MASMLVVVYDSIATLGAVPDFDQNWFAAKSLFQGRDPRALIGQDREFAWTGDSTIGRTLSRPSPP